MKLLFENWRQYLKEEEEPDIVIEPGQGTRPEEKGYEENEETRAYAAKLKQLFLHNPTQAIHLGEQVDVNPALVASMRESLARVHELMRIYREANNMKDQAAVDASPIIGKLRNEDELYREFDRITYDIWQYSVQGPSLYVRRPQELHDLLDAVGDLHSLARSTRRQRDTTPGWVSKKKTDHPFYVDVRDWAGEPPK
jgi:hypothetical protein